MAAVSVSPLRAANDKAAEAASGAAPANPIVVVETSRGDIVIELFPEHAPLTVENFLRYVEDGFYDGTVIHRASRPIIGFAGIEADGTQRETRDPIRSEADNGLFHDRGTVAMWRTPAIHSATTEVIINMETNNAHNHRSRDRAGYGLTVFGKVLEGMDVGEEIGKTGFIRWQNYNRWPREETKIERIRLKGAADEGE
jgi:peptidyl-prolyl cis-trans isomerase B (cyclophilin B)